MNGETGEKIDFERGIVCEIRANIDDMTAEDLGFVMDLLLAEGALDVWFQPIQMKKNRPGVMLSVLAPVGEKEKFARLILLHTSTFGVRICKPERIMLFRRTKIFETRYGSVRIKEGLINGEPVKSMPEYDDVKKIAGETGVPISQVRKNIAEDEMKHKNNIL